MSSSIHRTTSVQVGTVCSDELSPGEAEVYKAGYATDVTIHEATSVDVCRIWTKFGDNEGRKNSTKPCLAD